MTKQIAVVTGASAGIGKEFARLMTAEPVDEVWAIARSHDKLSQLRNELGEKIVPISLDLTDPDKVRSIGSLLEREQPQVAYLVNNAGMARMGSYEQIGVDELEKTVSINCSAFIVLCTLCIPFMSRGSRILNISSASSFQPLPYLNVYAATKVFELYYSRALNVELSPTGITATAVCR